MTQPSLPFEQRRGEATVRRGGSTGSSAAAEAEARRICILQLWMEEFPDVIRQSLEETKNDYFTQKMPNKMILNSSNNFSYVIVDRLVIFILSPATRSFALLILPRLLPSSSSLFCRWWKDEKEKERGTACKMRMKSRVSRCSPFPFRSFLR